MPLLPTRYFGEIEYAPDSLVEFPAGLPGFEDRRRFVLVSFPSSEPIVYVQSQDDPALCFITLPVWAVEPGYVLQMNEEDRALIGFEPAPRPGPQAGALCLTVVSVKEEGTTVNLLAPLVVNMASRKAVQAIAPGSDYSWRRPLFQEEREAVAC